MSATYATLGSRWLTTGNLARRVIVVELVTPSLVKVRDEQTGDEWLERADVIESRWTRRASLPRMAAVAL